MTSPECVRQREPTFNYSLISEDIDILDEHEVHDIHEGDVGGEEFRVRREHYFGQVQQIICNRQTSFFKLCYLIAFDSFFVYLVSRGGNGPIALDLTRC